MTRRAIHGGLYVVVDLKPGSKTLLPKLQAALDGGVDVVQLWNSSKLEEPYEEVVTALCNLAHQYDVPVLIHENWQWLITLPLDGVHFDNIPENFSEIKQQIKRPFVAGVTCGNDLDVVRQAIRQKIDYVSFCSMFPSDTATSCQLVHPDVVRQCRSLTTMPIFVAGGITCDNLPLLLSLGIDGVAVVSGIMKADNVREATKQFKLVMQSDINKILRD